jgi:hypothetical protein
MNMYIQKIRQLLPLYRGKYRNGKWFYGGVSWDEKRWTYFIHQGEVNNGQNREMVNCISQFTGWYDLHGKPIYEGDIIQYQTTLCCVEFNQGFVYTYLETVNDRNPISIDFTDREEGGIQSFIVVGNIWDDIELIEEYCKNYKETK